LRCTFPPQKKKTFYFELHNHQEIHAQYIKQNVPIWIDINNAPQLGKKKKHIGRKINKD